jgi:glycosyltransferase involved in cell wall biosynthesis
MPPPRVSVVIPTYQRADLLVEAVRSVLAQTLPDLEVLVEDDGSTDGSAEVVARLGDPRVSFRRAENVGRPGPVRNRGIARARGAFVAFLDSDDVWEPRKLEVQVAALERDPDLLGVSCDASWLPPRKKTLLAVDADVRPSFADLLARNVVCTSGAVFRREALDAVGGFDEDPAIQVEDYDLWLRLLRHRDRSLLVLREPLFRYRASASGYQPRGRRELDAIRKVSEKHLDFRPELVREVLANRERDWRQGELRERLRDGSLTLRAWLRAPEVPLRRRLRYAAKAVLFGRRST